MRRPEFFGASSKRWTDVLAPNGVKQASVAETESKPLSRGLQDRALLILEVAVGLAVVAAIMGKAYGTAPTVIFLLCGAAATYTGYNAFRLVSSLGDPTLDIQGRVRDEDREALEYEKKLILQGIKELEADYGVGKVDARDYQTLRQTAEERAVRIIAQLREDDAEWKRRAEKLLASKLPGVAAAASLAPSTAESATSEPKSKVVYEPPSKTVFDDRIAYWTPEQGRMKCGVCGTLNDADGRFCTGCGRPRSGGQA